MLILPRNNIIIKPKEIPWYYIKINILRTFTYYESLVSLPIFLSLTKVLIVTNNRVETKSSVKIYCIQFFHRVFKVNTDSLHNLHFKRYLISKSGIEYKF